MTAMPDPTWTEEMLEPSTADERLCFATIDELRAALDGNEVTSAELVSIHLARIDRLNPRLKAYMTVLHEAAQRDAESADERRRRGTILGLLDGIPVSVKDIEPMAGVRHTMGLRSLADNIATTDATHTQRLRAGGAVILGKTNTPELGHKGTTDNLLLGPTSNPYAAGFNAGGSSGGAAASVAAGLAAAAQGSDGGGSVRIPAAMCGLVGLKSSAFAVPDVTRPDAFAASTPYLHIGPLTRTVSDALVFVDAIATHHPRDPQSVPSGALEMRSPTTHPRIGFCPTFGNFPVDDDVARVTASAVDALAGSGVGIVDTIEVGLPDHDQTAQLWLRLISVLYAFIADVLARDGIDLLGSHRADIPDELAKLIEMGTTMSALDHRRDSAARTVVFDAIEDAFDVVDVIATPCLGVAGVPNGRFGATIGPTEIGGRPVEPTIGWCLTYPTNFSGHPSVTVPIGVGADGLPIGLQLIGSRWADRDLLGLAAGVEALIGNRPRTAAR